MSHLINHARQGFGPCRVLGIIAEYNPFHNGHLYHMRASKETTGAERVVVVMSGNFVQRGEPALCDKFARTRMALEGGADAVIELPTLFAASAAGDFADAAVTLLERTGVVNCLCFGSESGNLADIEAARDLLDEDAGFGKRLRGALGNGASFPAAFGAAAKGAEDGAAAGNAGGGVPAEGADGGVPGSSVFDGPNGTLGALYLNALKKLGSGIAPYTVKRGDYASASEIRKTAGSGRLAEAADALPPFAYEILSRYGGRFPALEDYSMIFQYLVKTGGEGYLKGILGMDEGLHNRFTRFAGERAGLAGILAGAKTRRYTYTRLQRAALHAVLGIKKDDAARFKALGGPQYIRVLGFRRERAALVGEIGRKAGLPVIVNMKNARKRLGTAGVEMLETEIRMTDIYNLALGAFAGGEEYRRGPVIL
ncbi:MAG: nucleotidyltransferase family protein [Firmicutes bacterium]|nr:nucleotidyltransferase family protein [Bacillota bacterium]